MSSRTCFGISKVDNLLKSLDSESILKQVQDLVQPRCFLAESKMRGKNDKIGISFIMIQPDCRSPARSGTGRERVWQVPFGTSFLAEMSLINEKMPIRPLWLII